MTMLGIGPNLAIIGGVVLIPILVLEYIFGISFALPPPYQAILKIAGTLIVVAGLLFYGSSARLVIKAFKAHQLETSGPFRFSRNPLYAAFIVFIIPGAALIVNNLIILLVSVVLFVVFKMKIGKEEEYLRKEFGVEFDRYCQEVAQLVPFIKI